MQQCLRLGAIFLVVCLYAAAAQAAPGFIESSRIFVDGSSTSIEIRFNCKVEYLRHDPQGSGDRLRIYLDPTTVCNGTSPLAAESRGRYRPVNADAAHLIDLEYDGQGAGGPVLTLSFSETVDYTIDAGQIDFRLGVQVQKNSSGRRVTAMPDPNVEHRQVIRDKPDEPGYVINLASFDRVPTEADVPGLALMPGQRLFYSEDQIDGKQQYRLRLGNFESADDARIVLSGLTTEFPEAWIDQLEPDSVTVDVSMAAMANEQVGQASRGSGTEIASLMRDARQAMIDGNTSQAIQIYTKILRLPEDPLQVEAQEYLALAREKNGQMAHAKAEYERYLSVYPDAEGATRVKQRLAAMLAANAQVPRSGSTANSAATSGVRQSANAWRMQTYVSQYYRRDVNQQNDEEEIVSQSALYSDINFDARRRGERFDFSSRISAGYRNDFLDDRFASGSDTRISYAYADLADAVTGLRGRLGRQSRNSGGILGRFDGFNLGYQATERLLVNGVIGKPAYSANDGIDDERTFYGLSANYGPMIDGLDLGVFFVQQNIEGITDRQAIGGEFRYFGENKSLWGLVDYDLQYEDVGSAYLQASWRFLPRSSIHGSVDVRHSPFLSAGNAIIGQPVSSFSELMQIFTEDEIRELGLDRSAQSTSYSLGISHTLTPKLQINADASQSDIDATPDSGGVFGNPSASYRYFSTNVVASSLFKEGDVAIVGFRYSDSDTSEVLSMTLDSRFPFGRSWRINPRLRVDRRERIGDPDYEWIYTPGIRIQYRRSQKLRFELEAGKQFAKRELPTIDLDRESYFINLGYQAFF